MYVSVHNITDLYISIYHNLWYCWVGFCLLLDTGNGIDQHIKACAQIVDIYQTPDF